MRREWVIVFWLSIGGLFLGACGRYSPRPSGYFRIDLPAPAYGLEEFARFSCLVSQQARVEMVEGERAGVFFNLAYEEWNVRIYCSYLPVEGGDVSRFSEESRKFAYLHAVRADGIGERRWDRPEVGVHGLLYDIRGEVASPVQFVLTDSVRSFFRGALYFEFVPNRDSIEPVLEYINRDILVLMESFRWKERGSR
jgi:gliding motility-associated lipoprotein GldD